MPEPRRITRRTVLTGLFSLASVGLLSACGGAPASTGGEKATTGGEQAKSTDAGAAKPAAAKSEVSLRFSAPVDAHFQSVWQNWFTGPFKQRNSHISVTVESTPWAEYHSKILAQAASRTLPDSMYSQGPFAQQFIKNGVWVELDPYMKADAKFQERGGIDDFFPEGIRPYQTNGKTYALPYDFGPACMVYYKPIFDKAGVPYPTNEWTYEDFQKAALQLTKPGETWAFEPVPMGDWVFEQTYLRPWGGRLVNDDETEILITSPEAQTALQFWADLVLKHKAIVSVAERKNFDQAPFLTKRVALTRNGAWGVQGYNRAGMTGEYDVVFMPKGPKERSTAAMGSGFGMAFHTAHKEDAWILVREQSDEAMEEVYAAEGRSAHARKSHAPLALTIPDIPVNAKAWIEAQEHGHMGQPISPVAPRINDIVTREMELLFIGQKSVKEACETIKRDCDPLVAENKR